MKDFVYDRRRHSRTFEQQADSMALVYLKKTPYNRAQAATSLMLLDTLDESLFKPTFDVKTVFNFPQFRFKDRWIAEEETMFRNGKRVFDNAFNKDSAKTHPDCVKRAEWVLEHVKGSASGKNDNIYTPDNFQKTVKMARFESVLAEYRGDAIDDCIFHTLQLLQLYPDDVFLNTLVGKCFNTLYAAQKAHTFSKLVSLPRVDKPEPYQPFLRFLNNLNLRELSGIAYNYLVRCPETFQNDEAFLAELALAAKSFEQNDALIQLKEKYKTAFPNGQHKDLIFKL